MLYPINEIFYSLQGEGYWSGRAAFFVRFAGCNLSCEFCDTDHTINEKLSHSQIIERILKLADVKLISEVKANMVVLTGGEPTIHDLNPLIKVLQDLGFYVALETNGEGDYI